MSDADTALARIDALFSTFGHRAYDGRRRESVTALEHALQCAQLAEWAGADASYVAAALLHDIGHFADGLDDAHAHGDSVDDGHETRALPWLQAAFGPAVTEPIRLHVAAKRYLVATEPAYHATLSAASIHSLALQGGPMNSVEVEVFEAEPHAPAAVLLRRWDDAAKTPGKRTPPLAYYLSLLEDLVAPAVPSRTVLSAFDAA